jgi:hypothetical protein
MPYSYRETALNWLALGLLLAAWNAADDNAATDNAATDNAANREAPRSARAVPRRPAALRAYAQVSVRAVTRMTVPGS